MEQFLVEMAELFEVDCLNELDEITSFDTWDSLTSLSIIAFVDDNYGVSISATELVDSKTFQGLFNLIKSK